MARPKSKAPETSCSWAVLTRAFLHTPYAPNIKGVITRLSFFPPTCSDMPFRKGRLWGKYLRDLPVAESGNRGQGRLRIPAGWVVVVVVVGVTQHNPA